MTTTYADTGAVPPDTPPAITTDAESLEDLLRRITRMRASRGGLVVAAAPRRRWAGMAWACAAVTIAAAAAAVVAILAGEPAIAWACAGAMILAWVGIFAAVTHHERDGGAR